MAESSSSGLVNDFTQRGHNSVTALGDAVDSFDVHIFFDPRPAHDLGLLPATTGDVSFLLSRPYEALSSCHAVHVDGFDTPFHILAGFTGHIVSVQLSGRPVPLFMFTSSAQQHFADILTAFCNGKESLRCKCVQPRE